MNIYVNYVLDYINIGTIYSLKCIKLLLASIAIEKVLCITLGVIPECFIMEIVLPSPETDPIDPSEGRIFIHFLVVLLAPYC